MSLETLHFINNVPIRPVNADEIGFKFDWLSDAEEAELTVDTIILSGKAKQLVLDHIDQLGIFEGIPYTVQVQGESLITLEYFIVLSDDPILSGEGDSEIEVSIMRRNAVDKFRQDANGLSFESLNINFPITTIDIPYLIIKDNQAEMLIMLGISIYTLTKALIEGIVNLVIAIKEGLDALPGASAAGPVVQIGSIAAFVLMIVARVVFLAAILLALIDLTKQVIELIFPPIRKLKAAQVKHLCERGCEKLGFQFQSTTVLDEYPELTILPVPLQEDQNSIFTNLFTLDNGSYTKGYPTAKDTTSRLGSLFDFLEEWSNSKMRIIGNIVYLEEDNFWQENSGVQITNTLNLQDKRENRYGFNAGDWWKRYLIQYRVDPSDTHTMDKIEKTDVEYSTEPVTVVNEDLVSIKGLVRINPPFAFGIRKESLSFVEEAAIPFAKLADEVVSFFGGDSNLEAKIQGRIGVTQISQQYYSIPKLLYQVGGRQPGNYLSKIGARAIYERYHESNQVKQNFKRGYTAIIPFSTTNFEQLLENNFVTDAQTQESLEVQTIEWINNAKQATIEYTIKSDEGDNTQTILING